MCKQIIFQYSLDYSERCESTNLSAKSQKWLVWNLPEPSNFT